MRMFNTVSTFNHLVFTTHHVILAETKCKVIMHQTSFLIS